MDERTLRIRLGIVVLAALAVTLFLVVLFGITPQLFQPKYTIKVGFPRAPGVARDTPVRKDGVPIGRVSGILLRDEGGVVLTMQIEQGRTLRMYERARISTGSLVTGDAIVEFVRDMEDDNDELIQDGDYLPNHGAVAGDPLELMVRMEGRMTEAFESIQLAGNTMSSAFTRIEEQLDNLFDKEQVDRIALGVEDALNAFTDAMTEIEDLVGDEKLRQMIQEASAELPPLLRKAQTTLLEIKQAAATFRGAGASLERNLTSIEQVVEPLGTKGSQLIDTLESTVKNADQVINELVVLTRRVNAGEGTIGRLATDEALYDDVRRVLSNIEYLSKRLRPIVDDVRIITDKVSRDPGTVVRGLIDRQGGIKRSPQ